MYANKDYLQDNLKPKEKINKSETTGPIILQFEKWYILATTGHYGMKFKS